MNIKQYDGYTSEDAPGYEVRIENNGDNLCIYKDGKFIFESSYPGIDHGDNQRTAQIILETLSFFPKS